MHRCTDDVSRPPDYFEIRLLYILFKKRKDKSDKSDKRYFTHLTFSLLLNLAFGRTATAATLRRGNRNQDRDHAIRECTRCATHRNRGPRCATNIRERDGWVGLYSAQDHTRSQARRGRRAAKAVKSVRSAAADEERRKLTELTVADYKKIHTLN